MIHRRKLLTGLSSLFVAPAIIPYAHLMPVRGIIQNVPKMRFAANGDWVLEDIYTYKTVVLKFNEALNCVDITDSEGNQLSASNINLLSDVLRVQTPTEEIVCDRRGQVIRRMRITHE